MNCRKRIIFLSLLVPMLAGWAADSPTGGASNLLTMVAISARWSNSPIAVVQKAAETGDATAQYFVGWRYYWGQGVESNRAESARWYRQAAENGLAAAQYRLANISELGLGVPINADEALRWYEAAARQGHGPAAFALGRTIEARKGNLADAVEWYERSADAGFTNAAYRLSELYTYADRFNEAKHYQWLQRAAELGHVRAAYQIGAAYRVNHTTRTANLAEAVRWLNIAAAAGHFGARCQLAYMLDLGEGMPADSEKAYQTLLRLAEGDASNPSAQEPTGVYFHLAEMCEQGRGTSRDLAAARRWYQRVGEESGEALLRLGRMYETGSGGPIDESLAVSCYRQAVEMGKAAAIPALLQQYVRGHGLPPDPELTPRILNYLGGLKFGGAAEELYCAGELHRLGIVVTKDPGKALDLFTNAATRGSAEAEVRIGEYWRDGQIEAPDLSEAAQWFQRAALRGHPQGQFLLGQTLASKKGTADPVAALKWTILASRQGVEAATKALPTMESSVTAEQRAAARQAADAFKPLGSSNAAGGR